MTGPDWLLLVGFLVLVVAGIVLLAWIFSQRAHSSGPAHRILEERLARGEITTDEFEQRRGLLSHQAGARRWSPFAVALLSVGAIGAALVLSFAPDWSFGSMMGGGMGGMGSMMGSSNTQRNAPAPEKGAQVVAMSAREFAFTPSSFTVTAGDTVNVRFTNDGTMFHTFTVEGQDFSLEAKAGDSVEGALRLDKPGSYRFFCSVSGHEQAGMRGEITATS